MRPQPGGAPPLPRSRDCVESALQLFIPLLPRLQADGQSQKLLGAEGRKRRRLHFKQVLALL